MAKVTRIVLYLVAGVAIVGAAGFALKKYQGQREATVTPAAVATVSAFDGIEFAPLDLTEAKRADLRQAVRLSGTLQPFDQSVIKAEVAATVTDVAVRRGETVKKGQLLARLDTRDLGARLRERESNLASAKAALELAQINRTKATTLYRSGVKSQAAVDEAENAYANARANVAAIEQQVTMARKALGDAAIYAPIDGLVADRMANPGERVAVDARLFAIANLSVMEMEALVPAREVPRLRVGQAVRLKVEGFDDRVFDGQIERINPTAKEGSRSIPVFIRLQNPDLVLRGGMFGSGEAVLAEAAGVVAVPGEAVRLDPDGTAHVFVLTQGKLSKRKVALGLTGTTDGRAEIRSGVEAGETVVATPGLKLTDGLAARVAGR